MAARQPILEQDSPDALSRAELNQYSRQLILEELGIEGQQALKRARVLVVGAGGLGSPVLLYLAAAGVGTLGVVEHDVIDQTNLHRQILFDSHQIGQRKIDAATARIRALNPYIHIEAHEARLSVDNALDLIGRYDVVVDATDNFPTRYLINDACVLLGKPNVSASIFRFEGQLSVFWPGRGPCYRCLYPEPPPPDLVPSCAEGGVLGVLPGIVGTLQAGEVIKAIVGFGEPLVGRLLTFDALTMRFREFNIERSPECPVCAPNAKIKELTAYDALCSMRPAVAPSSIEVPEVSARELRDAMANSAVYLLDVRNPGEYAITRIEPSHLIPLSELEARIDELPRNRPIVCYCQSGKRSAQATQLLRSRGFDVRSLRGGIEAWARL